MDTLGDAEIVVIGGEVGVGCGVVHSLCQAGKTDVLLLEKNEAIASETTSQAAGLVGQVRTSVDRVKVGDVVGQDLLRDGGRAGGQERSWRQVGSLRVALTERASGGV